MAFIETPRFSTRLAVGMQGGPGFSTDVQLYASGEEQRNQNWAQARHEYDAATTVRTLADYAEIRDFFFAMAGRVHGFRFKDFADFECDHAASGRLQPQQGGVDIGTVGSGFGVPVYQLAKRYVAGSLSHTRRIRKPVAGQVAVRRGGVDVVVGGGAGQIAIDTTTGLITFVPDQNRGITAHTVGAAHQITLSSAFSPNVAIGQHVWVSGVTGTAAALLNDRQHVVSAVSGALITLGVVTTGLTASSGAAALYPQQTESLTWSGQFDVPVRFDIDRLPRTIITAGTPTGAIVSDSIPIVEIRA